jgi:single-stranded-DNA-specific exonuclease
LHRPVIAFAAAQQDGLLKGSGRSIPGLHLRDALASIDAQSPGLIERFGGHAMAAGLTLRVDALERFRLCFDAACRALLDSAALQHCVETDGALAPAELCIQTARLFEEAGPWGQGFPEPVFDDVFDLVEARPVGADAAHIKYRLRHAAGIVSAIHFNGAASCCSHGRVRVAYMLAVNRWRDSESLDLRVVTLQVLPE